MRCLRRTLAFGANRWRRRRRAQRRQTQWATLHHLPVTGRHHTHRHWVPAAPPVLATCNTPARPIRLTTLRILSLPCTPYPPPTYPVYPAHPYPPACAHSYHGHMGSSAPHHEYASVHRRWWKPVPLGRGTSSGQQLRSWRAQRQRVRIWQRKRPRQQHRLQCGRLRYDRRPRRVSMYDMKVDRSLNQSSFLIRRRKAHHTAHRSPGRHAAAGPPLRSPVPSGGQYPVSEATHTHTHNTQQ